MYFNPRSHEGSDQQGQTSMTDLRYFNPRSHEGSDYAKANIAIPTGDFNPRSHEGSDGRSTIDKVCRCKFQSTLPRRERLGMDGVAAELKEFQSTLPRRERRRARYPRLLFRHNFNPRSHEGSDFVSSLNLYP